MGAVAVLGGRVIAAASNRMERSRDPTAHAEMLVLRRAARAIGGWRLTGVVLAVTLEPCPMCAGAMLQARIARCVYGASDPRRGADGSVYDVLSHPGGLHRIAVSKGVLAEPCAALISEFFRQQRRRSR